MVRTEKPRWVGDHDERPPRPNHGELPFGMREWPALPARIIPKRKKDGPPVKRLYSTEELEDCGGRVPRLISDAAWRYIAGSESASKSETLPFFTDHAGHESPVWIQDKDKREGRGRRKADVSMAAATILDWLASPYRESTYEDWLMPPRNGIGISNALKWWSETDQWVPILWRFLDSVLRRMDATDEQAVEFQDHVEQGEMAAALEWMIPGVDGVIGWVLAILYSEGAEERVNNETLRAMRGLRIRQRHRITQKVVATFAATHWDILKHRIGEGVLNLGFDELDIDAFLSLKPLRNVMVQRPTHSFNRMFRVYDQLLQAMFEMEGNFPEPEDYRKSRPSKTQADMRTVFSGDESPFVISRSDDEEMRATKKMYRKYFGFGINPVFEVD